MFADERDKPVLQEKSSEVMLLMCLRRKCKTLALKTMDLCSESRRLLLSIFIEDQITAFKKEVNKIYEIDK